MAATAKSEVNGLVVYSPQASPRLRYICSFLEKYYGLTTQISADEKIFSEKSGAKIWYSAALPPADAVWIKPHGLLFEKGVFAQKVSVGAKDGFPVLFPSEQGYGFDLLAAIFYLITRYEEYLPHSKDEFGRYNHVQSIAYKNGFLQLPLINIWLWFFANAVREKNGVVLPLLPFRFLPTYDIDLAWSFLHKDWWRTAGGAAKAILQGEIAAVRQRIRVLSGKEKDPFHVYEDLHALHTKYGLEPIYFFPMGEQINRYDKNIVPKKRALQKLIGEHASRYDIGLHPSWRSEDEQQLLAEELSRLEQITGKKITASRQHYIRFNLPHTYGRLIEAGITDDYSMGYGSVNGFRASIAAPFYWYDLEKEEATSLLVHPFCFMDANALFEQKLSPEAASDELMGYYHSLQRWGGTLITIWHNNILGTDKLYRGWSQVYKNFITAVQQP